MKKILSSFGVCMSLAGAMSAQTLIGHWPFTGNANDSSGNNLNGTVYNATLTSGESGVSNTAYYFNGTDAHIDVPYDSLLNLTSWTIQAVVYPEGWNQDACHSDRIMSRGTDNAGDSYFLQFTDNNVYGGSCSTYRPDSSVFSSGGPWVNDSVTWNTPNFVKLNTWYCVTTTYSNGYINLYLDGTLINSGYWGNAYSYGSSNPILSFGYYNEGGVNYKAYFNGKIDDISIWSGVLSVDQITDYCSKVHDSTTATGIKQVYNNQDISISPNPATNALNVRLPDNGNTILYIINEVGQTVITYNTSKAANVIDISKLPAGMYILKTALENGTIQTTKFVKN